MTLKEIKEALLGKGLNQFYIFTTVADYNGSNYEPKRNATICQRAFEIKHIRYEKRNNTYVIANSKQENDSIWINKSTLNELIENKRVITRTFMPACKGSNMGQYCFNDIAIQYYPIGKDYDTDNWKEVDF